MKVAIKDKDGEISTGTVSDGYSIGDYVEADSWDENGYPIVVSGYIVDIA